MAKYAVHKDNLVYEEFADDFDFTSLPDDIYLKDATIGAGVDITPEKYRKIDGTSLVVMDQTEQDAVDAQEIVNARTVRKLILATQTRDFIETHCPLHNQETLTGLLILAHAADPVLTNRAAYVENFMTWRDGVMEAYYVAGDTIDAASNVSAINAVAIDHTPFEDGSGEVEEFPGADIRDAREVPD